ncbi:hypothetical protein [uncultured Shewanella sp.]|uniref:hypothetical protein n=1 Tax=uncultured Shewanella sp. TaxID=173975 RepID=UPI0026330B9C|nr:hypothetical protein [uncultured Shewanella sp.]
MNKLNDFLLPMESMKDIYGGQISVIELKDIALLKQSYPIAFYTMVNILIDSYVVRNRQCHFLPRPCDILKVVNSPSLKVGEIRWEKAFNDKDRSLSLLKSECIYFIDDDKINILYLYFDKNTASSVRFNWNIYYSLLKEIVRNIELNSNHFNVNSIVIETYNPNVKEILLKLGFKIQSESMVESLLPASKMLLDLF